MITWNSIIYVLQFPLAVALSLVVGYVWGFLSTLFHEASHAISAYLVGFPAYCIEIGKGHASSRHLAYFPSTCSSKYSRLAV